MFTWMGLAAPRCWCLGSFPSIADARSSLVWTKAAPGLTTAPASPRALQTTAQTWEAHVFSLKLKPGMLIWTACTPRCALSWLNRTCMCVITDATWMDQSVWWLLHYISLHLYKNCRLMGTKNCYMDYVELWVFFSPDIYHITSCSHHITFQRLELNHFARFLP